MRQPQPQIPPQLIDAMQMARFLVLPGASRLLEAFATIPPGPLRDSVIAHAEVIAATYSGAPPEARMPDPLVMATQLAGTAQALPRPGAKALPGPSAISDTPHGQAVALSLQGMRPNDVAAQLGVGVGVIYDAKREARSAGVVFPNLIGQRGKSAKGKGKIRFAQKVWHTDMSTVSPGAYGQMKSAAEVRGIDVEEYLSRRKTCLDMAMQGRPAYEIAGATGEDEKVIKNWLSQARGTGLSIPYSPVVRTAEVEEAPPRVFPNLQDMTKQARVATENAARRRGLTPQAYMDLRESIVQHRMAGKGQAAIAEITGEKYHMVKDTLDIAKQVFGVSFPALSGDAE